MRVSRCHRENGLEVGAQNRGHDQNIPRMKRRKRSHDRSSRPGVSAKIENRIQIRSSGAGSGGALEIGVAESESAGAGCSAGRAAHSEDPTAVELIPRKRGTQGHGHETKKSLQRARNSSAPSQKANLGVGLTAYVPHKNPGPYSEAFVVETPRYIFIGAGVLVTNTPAGVSPLFAVAGNPLALDPEALPPAKSDWEQALSAKTTSKKSILFANMIYPEGHRDGKNGWSKKRGSVTCRYLSLYTLRPSLSLSSVNLHNVSQSS